MDASSPEGLVFDPSKCSNLTMEQKRELVYELSKWSEGAPEMLKTWSRQDILQILCAELGKERKYTGLTKVKIIEHLLKVVSEKKSRERGTSDDPKVQPSSESGERTPKRQRKSDHPTRLPVAANSASTSNLDVDIGNTRYCKNSACKAKLNYEDAFCRRCTCCICRKYDDNKDPSLWLICSSDPPFEGHSCGLSCHLECALRHEKSGIAKDRQDKGLDGSFCCISCGKVNDLLSSWRKQLIIAKETRRVDILCYRLSLSQKILAGTKHYQELYEIVNEAVKKLEADVGPLTGSPVKTARGIVNRLSAGSEVQRLCASSVEALDSLLSSRMSKMPSDCNMMAANLVRFEDICASSLTVVLNSQDIVNNFIGYTLWHRKANDVAYPTEPTGKLFPPNTRFLLSDLTPATDYCLKVVALDSNREVGMCEVQFRTNSLRNETSNMIGKSSEVERSQSPATNCSSLSNPSSVEDETNNTIPCGNEDDNRGDNYIPYPRNVDQTAPATLHEAMINSSDQSQKETTEDTVSFLDDGHNIGKISSTSDAGNQKKRLSSDAKIVEEISTDNGSDNALPTGVGNAPCIESSEAGLPITPCKLENAKDSGGRNSRPKLGSKDLDTVSGREEEPQAGSSSKKRSGERRTEECAGIGDKDFEYYVKVIRWLECDGHIETAFRQKFLTWYSLRATPQEVRIVKVFIDTFIEDPESLAGQLVDTFSEVMSNKRSSVVPAGFCLKLWH